MSRIAIIPARGGSKRIARKNIRHFLGKPIIAYSIEAAIQSGLFDEVMVSTEDLEIAEIAVEYGANVPFLRTEENASDFAPTVDVLLEVLSKYNNQGRTFIEGCCIYPTAPFVNCGLLKKGFSTLTEGGHETVFPVVAFSYPIWRALKLSGNQDRADMFWPENVDKRSQDLTPAYHDAGQFYCFNTHSLINNKRLYTGNTGVLIRTELEVQDIDNLVDWKIAEMKYKMLNEA